MRTGFSNLKLSENKINKGFNNIFDLVLHAVDEKWNKFLDKEKLNINVEPKEYPKFKILIKVSHDGSRVKQNAVSYIIELDVDYGKSEELNSLAHEVVHISQKYNNFKDYSFDKDYTRYKEINSRRKNKVTYGEYYRESSHDKLGTEQKCKLVQLFNCLELKI